MTLPEKLRSYALGPTGGYEFWLMLPRMDDEFYVLRRYCCGTLELSERLTPDERRMFCLFVAEAIS